MKSALFGFLKVAVVEEFFQCSQNKRKNKEVVCRM